jgi:hypothetical protein
MLLTAAGYWHSTSPGSYVSGNGGTFRSPHTRFVNAARVGGDMTGQSMPTGYGMSGLGPSFIGGLGGFRSGGVTRWKFYAHRMSASGSASSSMTMTGKGVASCTIRIGFQPSADEIADAVWQRKLVAHTDPTTMGGVQASGGGGGGGGGGGWPGTGQFWP